MVINERNVRDITKYWYRNNQNGLGYTSYKKVILVARVYGYILLQFSYFQHSSILGNPSLRNKNLKKFNYILGLTLQPFKSNDSSPSECEVCFHGEGNTCEGNLNINCKYIFTKINVIL